MKAEKVQIDQVFMDPANARTHPQKNMEAIRGSLQRFGQQKPIVIDQKGCVIAGNGTLMAAQQLGWDTIQAVRTTLEGAQAAAFAIADNRTAELAEWDEQALMQTLTALDLEDPTLLDAAGFDKQSLEEMINGLLPDEPAEGLTDPDEVPEQCETRCQPGDLWQLGDHRLLCGSSAESELYQRLFDGAQFDMLLSDPPYGVSYVGKTKEKLTIENDGLDEKQLTALMKDVFDLAQAQSRPGAYWYATVPAGPLMLVFLADWRSREILRQCLIWKKNSLVLGRSEYHYKHEPILFGWVKGKRHQNQDRTRDSVWEFDRPTRSAEHPTMKPVALWQNAIRDGSRNREIVFDPFLGSGTTIIACEQMERRGFGFELSPTYCDVILTRWEQFTGQKAEKLDG